MPFTTGTEIISEEESNLRPITKSFRAKIKKMNRNQLIEFYSKNIGEFNPIDRNTGKNLKNKEIANMILDYMAKN